jgi:hypothetical protein
LIHPEREGHGVDPNGVRPARKASLTKERDRPPSTRDWITVSGGRTWWAHFEFTRINITPTILPKKIEALRILGAICVV